MDPESQKAFAITPWPPVSFPNTLIFLMGESFLIALSSWNASFVSSLLMLFKMEFKSPFINALFADPRLILSTPFLEQEVFLELGLQVFWWDGPTLMLKHYLVTP